MNNRLAEQSTVADLAELLTRVGARLTNLGRSPDGQYQVRLSALSRKDRVATGLTPAQAINRALDALGVPVST